MVVAVGEVRDGVGAPGQVLSEGFVGAVRERLGDGVALGSLNGLPAQGHLAVPGSLGAGRRRGRVGGCSIRNRLGTPRYFCCRVFSNRRRTYKKENSSSK